MAHAIRCEELLVVLDVAHPSGRLCRIAGEHRASHLDRCPAALAVGMATGHRRRPEPAAGVRRGDAVLHRLHLRLSAGRRADRQYPADAPDHCHRPAARQYDPNNRRPVRPEFRVRSRLAGADPSGRALRAPDGLPPAHPDLDRRLSLSDGLCRTAAAADQHRLESRRGRASRHRRRLSGQASRPISPRRLPCRRSGRRHTRCSIGANRPSSWRSTSIR